MRRTLRPGSFPHPGRSPRTASRPAPASGSTPASRRAARSSGLYDPMVAKLLRLGRRSRARPAAHAAGPRRARVEGVPTLAPLHRPSSPHPSFAAGETCAGLVERLAAELAAGSSTDGAAPAAAVPADERRSPREVDGRRYEVVVLVPGDAPRRGAPRRAARAGARRRARGPRSDVVQSPMQGTVLRVEVDEGEHVANGQVLLIVEAMKMENEITAHRDGIVRGLAVAAGDAVRAGDVLCVVEDGGEAARRALAAVAVAAAAATLAAPASAAPRRVEVVVELRPARSPSRWRRGSWGRQATSARPAFDARLGLALVAREQAAVDRADAGRRALHAGHRPPALRDGCAPRHRAGRRSSAGWPTFRAWPPSSRR